MKRHEVRESFRHADFPEPARAALGLAAAAMEDATVRAMEIRARYDAAAREAEALAAVEGTGSTVSPGALITEIMSIPHGRIE